MANLIQDIEVTGSAVAQVDMTGLNIVAGELYEVVITYKNAGVAEYIKMGVNNDITVTDYYHQELRVYGTTVAGGRGNNTYLTYTPANTTAKVQLYLKLTEDGHMVFVSKAIRDMVGSGIFMYDGVATSTFTMASITSLNFFTPGGNRLGVGTRIQLYKVAEKVDEVIVAGSAVTQVDFTGLDIGKDNEYLLVSDWYNPTGSTANCTLYINDDTTLTNYWQQQLLANGTSVASGRANASYYSFVGAGTRTLTISKIKLANSGYFNAQSTSAFKYGGSSIYIDKNYHSKTATVTSITKLNITSTVASQIGINSQFELYKLI